MAEIFAIGTLISGGASIKLLIDAVKLLLETTLPTYELLFVWMKFFFMLLLFFGFAVLMGCAYGIDDEKLKKHDIETPKIEKQRPNRRR